MNEQLMLKMIKSGISMIEEIFEKERNIEWKGSVSDYEQGYLDAIYAILRYLDSLEE